MIRFYSGVFAHKQCCTVKACQWSFNGVLKPTLRTLSGWWRATPTHTQNHPLHKGGFSTRLRELIPLGCPLVQLNFRQ